MDSTPPTIVLLCPQCDLANEAPATGKRTDEIKCAHCGNTFRRYDFKRQDVSPAARILKRRNLKSLNAVRKAVADVFNDVENGQMDLEKAKCLGFLAQTLTKLIEGAGLEKKIKALESAQKNGGPLGVVK